MARCPDCDHDPVDWRARVQRALGLIATLPGGIDREADPDDQSPDDMVAHVGGLVWRALKGDDR